MTAPGAISVCVVLLVCGAAVAVAQSPAMQTSKPPRQQTSTSTHPDPGERAFQANCNRCHNAPEQLSPRIAGTVLKHMRVRANLSAEDEKNILHYLAPEFSQLATNAVQGHTRTQEENR